MEEVWEFLTELFNHENIIRKGGLLLLLFVIFAETGLMVGFFLPGDSVVFIAGLICATEPGLMNVSLLELNAGLILAATAGNLTGYYFGKKVGPALFTKDDNIIFKKKYIELTRSFYNRHGGKTLILGRFLPIIRTFAPILAGVIKMNLRIFFLHTIAGAILWIASLTTAGYFLGEIAWVEENLGYIVILLIVITLIPIIRTWKQEKKNQDVIKKSSEHIK